MRADIAEHTLFNVSLCFAPEALFHTADWCSEKVNERWVYSVEGLIMQTYSTSFFNLCFLGGIFGKSLNFNSILLEYACTEYALYYAGYQVDPLTSVLWVTDLCDFPAKILWNQKKKSTLQTSGMLPN